VRGVERGGKTLDFFSLLILLWLRLTASLTSFTIRRTRRIERGELFLLLFAFRAVCAVRWVDRRIAFWSEKTGNLEKRERGGFFLFFSFGKVVRILGQKDLRKFSLQANLGLPCLLFIGKVNLETTGSSVY